jgi:hypothetical protein
LPGIQVTRHVPDHRPVPTLRIDLDGSNTAERAYGLINRLLAGEPGVAVDQSHAEHGRISINPMGLTEHEAHVAGRRLSDELSEERG